MPNTSTDYPSFKIIKSIFHHDKDFEGKMHNLLYAINESAIVVFTDIRGNITYANDKFCEISQYSREELVGRTHRIVNSGFHNKEFFKDIWRTIKSGHVWKGDIKNKAKDGTFYWVFTTIVPLLDEYGYPHEYVAIRFDITDKKRMEEEKLMTLQEIQKIKINQESSERFVSALTHDLKTPLATAKLSAQLIEKNLDRPEVLKSIAARLIQSVNRTDLMISDLLNANKIRAGQILPLNLVNSDIKETVEATLEELSVIHGPRFNWSIQGECVGAWSVSGIKRIIENLCNNAIKYGDPQRPVTVKLRSFKNYISISVHNWGEVIPKQETKNLFDYLQRSASAQSSEKEGWGIGLTLVKGMTESHGGVVDVTSIENEGTTFEVKLPKKFEHGYCQI